jgi:transcriptional antiterminator NusG
MTDQELGQPLEQQVAGPEPEPQAPPRDPADEGFGWYIVYCTVGREMSIKHKLEEKIKKTSEMRDVIREVLVPEEEEIQIHNGRKKVVRKAPYKGYIYVHMRIEPRSYWFIRGTPGVKGFLGGSHPEPMNDREVASIKVLLEKLKTSQPRTARNFDLGDSARIIDGPFKHFTGIIDEIAEDKGKLKMVVTVFGRPTSVELDFSQVEKV